MVEAVLNPEALSKLSYNYCNVITANRESLKGYLGKADEIVRYKNDIYERKQLFSPKGLSPYFISFPDTRKNVWN